MPGSTVGTRQIAVRDQDNTIKIRLLLDGVETDLTSATATVHDPSGTQLIIPSVSVTGAVASFVASFPVASFPLNEGYFVKWWLSYSGGLKQQKTYFDVVLRRFESQLTDEDITNLHPYISLATGQTSFASYRRIAWRKISRLIRSRFSRYPGDLFFPEDLFDAHLHLSLSEYFMSVSFESAGSEDWDKAQYFNKEGMDELAVVLSNVDVDMDEDGFLDTDEKHMYLGGAALVR